jgi:microcystin degradation protein MlrC
MKTLLCRFSHETNAFGKETTLDDFFDEVSGTPAQGFCNYLESKGATFHISFIATANPSGRVKHSEVFEHFLSQLESDIAEHKPDVLLLDLHGAMVTTHSQDAEGDFLERVRKKCGEKVVIGVALDLHGNISPKMLEFADYMECFKTYPHIDMVRTGESVAAFVVEEIFGRQKRRPFKSLRQIPLLSHTLLSRTDVAGEMLDAVNAGKALESKFNADSNKTSCSIFAGFALSDTPDAGMSVLVYSYLENNDFATFLATKIWSKREGFIYESLRLVESIRTVATAVQTDQKRVLVCDHGDNMFSGGAANSSAILKSILKDFELSRFLVGPICDPEMVRLLLADDAGKEQLKRVKFADSDLELEVTVVGQSEGEFVVNIFFFFFIYSFYFF